MIKKIDWNKKWPWMFWIVFGCVLSGLQLSEWYRAKHLVFTVPKFEELKVSQGRLSFTERWKSSGGEVLLRLDNGRKLTLKCGGPFINSACYMKKVDGQWKNFKDELTGQIATAWWYPYSEDNALKRDERGRLYQLRVGKAIFHQYETQIADYMNDYRLGKSTALPSAIVFFVLIVIPSLRKLFY